MNTAILVASLLAKCMIGGSFSTIYQQGGELFPTPVRSNAVGFINVIGNVGNIIAPFVLSLKIGGEWIPGAVFCGVTNTQIQYCQNLIQKSIVYRKFEIIFGKV